MANAPHPTPRPAPPRLASVPTPSRPTKEPMTGAQSVVRSLEEAGADVVFGIPGGAILPVYDPLFDSKLRHILVRHEQGAGHAATGYAAASGRVGVCMATSGPGATNLVTPIARSEEHTSELQSRGHLVCRLLLEKKKKKDGGKRIT